MTSNPSSQPHTHRILLADDESLVRDTLAEGLRGAGYEVVEATNGSEAISRAKETELDLAILDIRMPGISGVEAARRLQGRCPVLILSAHADRDLVEETVEEGAVGYLVKPVGMPALLAAVETALARAADLRRLTTSEARLSDALQRGREVSVAVGVVMERHTLDEKGAFDRLRRHARSHNLPMREVAQQVVSATETTNAFGNEAGGR